MNSARIDHLRRNQDRIVESDTPRFYFHMQTDTRHTDVDGADYDTYAEARKAAIQTCGQMMQDAPETFLGSRPWSVTVTDDAGLIMWEIQLDGQSTAASRGLEGQRA